MAALDRLARLPDPMRARPPVPDDLEAAAAAWMASEAHLYGGESDVTTSDLRSLWARPSFDLATDAVVVVAGEDEIVAYAESFDGRVLGGVAPGAQGRGIGGWLLDWAAAHARESGSPRLSLSVPEADVALDHLVSARGFERGFVTWMFWQPLGDGSDAPAAAEAPGPAPEVPAGHRLRNPDPDRDAEAMFTVIDAAFGEWPDRDERWTLEDWRSVHLDHEDTELRTSWVLEDPDGEVIGASLSLTDRGWGWLDQLAVRRDQRGRGLASLLLRHSLDAYRELGLHTAGLMTDSRTGARELYERNGYRVQKSYTHAALSLGN